MTKLNKMNAIELEELKSYYYDNYSYDDLLMLTLQESDKVDELMEELQRKDNNWNELKKWLDIKEEKEIVGTFSDVLDKIKELEKM